VKVLPADVRLSLYDETVRLREENGWGYRRIARALNRSRGIHVPRGTVANWILGRHNPARRLHRAFTPDASPELAYVIGAVLGDGYTTRDRGRAIVGFTNKDVDLLKHFQCALSEALGAPSVGRITSGTRFGTMKVTVGCTILALLLERPLAELVSFIDAYPADFIRGFFDAEGTAVVFVSESRLQVAVTVSNSNREILQYISCLLEKKFGSFSTLRIARNPGTYVIRGQPVIFKRPVFRLSILRIRDVEQYAKLINFASIPKRQRLEEGIAHLRQYGRQGAATHWLIGHRKVNSRWVTIG